MDRRPVALVLGAAVWPDGQPSPTLRRRAQHAAGLWHEGVPRAIVCCGGVGRHGPSEASVIAALLGEAGVPDATLHLEPLSTTTEENIRHALPILRALGATEVRIVTDSWHAPRAVLLARGLGLRARAAPVPWQGGRPAFQARMVLRESGAIVGNAVRLAWRGLR
ncbi:YdcF family protein [Citreimonas sp.]|uniref:YdcF family protein n=1 Tax=Citreimonas sp. TaxID=3036715 RepID=UPI00405883DA